MGTKGSIYLDSSATLVISDQNNCRIKLGNNISILSGAGNPEGRIVALKGSLYLRTDGTSSRELLYVNYDGNTNWGAFIATP